MKYVDPILVKENPKAIEYAEKIQAILDEAEKEGIVLYSKLQYGILTIYLDNVPVCVLNGWGGKICMIHVVISKNMT